MKCRLLLLILVLSVAPAHSSPSVKVGFSPSKTAMQNVLEVVNNAKNTLDVEAYSFTSKAVATALISAQKRGVKVRVIADAKANKIQYSAVTYLANHHIAVRLNDRYAIMHNKVMIADGHTVQTGSMNYTASADTRNAENSIVLRDMPKVAAQYQIEFNRLWEESTPLSPRY